MSGDITDDVFRATAHAQPVEPFSIPPDLSLRVDDAPIIRALKLQEAMTRYAVHRYPWLPHAEAEAMMWDWHERAGRISKELSAAVDAAMPEVRRHYISATLSFGNMLHQQVFIPIARIVEEAKAAERNNQ